MRCLILITIWATLNCSAYSDKGITASGEYVHDGICAMDKLNGVTVPFGSKVVLPNGKVLIVIGAIAVAIEIDRVRRTVVRADTERRHKCQALKLAVVFMVVAPAVLSVRATAECVGPQSCYISTVLWPQSQIIPIGLWRKP